MKKSTKIILITSACLILGGLLIAVVSGAIGGARQFKELADRQELSFEVPFADAQLRLNTSGLYFTSKDEPDREEERAFEAPEVSGETVAVTDAGEIKNIEMKLGAGEIKIKKSGNGTFHVGEGENMKIISDYKNGTLEIKAGIEGDIQVFGFSTGASVSAGSAVIYLPDQVYESVTIEMGAGVCTGDIPECGEFKIDLGAGEIDFDYVKADEMELKVGAGECKIGLLEVGTLDADIAMGEFAAKAEIGTELDANVGMGEIEMEIIGEESDFDYDVEVGAGEVRIGSRTYSGVGSGGSQENDTGREISVECGMGEATLRFVKE
ncbi:MAG: DUF4097 domain-containing protein [Lachnospiraceae bacterium]|nr:DUF4097 domain-containing protein [Lachnospiraceae bacterium]